MTQCTLIIVETKDSKKYAIAPKLSNKNTPQFEEEIKIIKERVISE